MTIKSFEAKIVTNPSLRETLEYTHRVYNEDLKYMVEVLLAMRKGKHSDGYVEFWREHLQKAANPSGLLEPLTTPDGPKADAKSKKSKIIRQLFKEHGMLFDRDERWPHWNARHRRHLFDDAKKWARQLDERLERWRSEHAQWLKEKEKFENENPLYMAVEPLFGGFFKEFGQGGKRRERWAAYYHFLLAHPELANWRGQADAIVPLTPEEEAACLRDRRRGVKKRLDLFLEKNPELEALHKLDAKYGRNMVRRSARHRNIDGFRHPPTMTLPHSRLHPEWITFQAGETYKDLDLNGGTVRLNILPPDAETSKLHSVEFRAEKRLRRITPRETPLRKGRNEFNKNYRDAADRVHPARVKGIRLILRPRGAYLKITVELDRPESRTGLKQQTCDKYSSNWCYQEIVKRREGKPLKCLSLDLGVRHLAVGVVVQETRANGDRETVIEGVRFFKEVGGRPFPSLDEIRRHKDRLREKRSQTRRAPKGRRTCIALQDHVTKMGQDRYRKGAAAIVRYAVERDVDVILLEKLAGFIPDAAKQRGINKALMEWNRRKIADFVKLLAADHGISVVEVAPHHLSQLCSKCGELGRRFSWKDGLPKFGTVEKLFVCPACGYQANSDYNAAVNLYKAFSGAYEERPKKAKKGVYKYRDRTICLKKLDGQLAERLTQEQTPF